MHVGGHDGGEEEQTVDDEVGVGAAEEQDGERGEDDVDEGYGEAFEDHGFGFGFGIGWLVN